MPTPKTKDKKCKDKNCKICKQPFTPRNPFQIVCGYKCANEYAKKHLKRESDQLWKKQKTELKEKTKTITRLKQEARKPFQKWIRLRDEKLGCISCGSTSSLIYDAGHFYKAELYSALIFDEQNCHKQCRKCNCFLNGNEIEYRHGLLMRYGGEYVAELERKVNECRIKKYERRELREIKTKYEIKIHLWEQQNKNLNH